MAKNIVSIESRKPVSPRRLRKARDAIMASSNVIPGQFTTATPNTVNYVPEEWERQRMYEDLDMLRARLDAGELIGFGIAGIASVNGEPASTLVGFAPSCVEEGFVMIAAMETLKRRFMDEWSS